MSADGDRRHSIKLELEPGEYLWCACGRSANDPFCDGSHAGTGVRPVRFTVTERTRVGYCACKATKTPPRCDHSHRLLGVGGQVQGQGQGPGAGGHAAPVECGDASPLSRPGSQRPEADGNGH